MIQKCFAILAFSILVGVMSPATGAEDEPNAAASESPKVGELAPDFTLRGSDGKDHKLSAYKGKQGVVIAWFPKAFTSG